MFDRVHIRTFLESPHYLLIDYGDSPEVFYHVPPVSPVFLIPGKPGLLRKQGVAGLITDLMNFLHVELGFLCFVFVIMGRML